MNITEQIENYIAGQPKSKRSDMQTLHELILETSPGCRLWYTDGKNGEGKVVANPSIGYGFYTIKYADGSTRDFYQIGLSANTAGISVYILGLSDNTYLSNTFGKSIGKASVTGYCIKFKTLEDIDVDVLLSAIGMGLGLRDLNRPGRLWSVQTRLAESSHLLWWSAEKLKFPSARNQNTSPCQRWVPVSWLRSTGHGL